jgi:hypothetical protein
MAVTTNSSIKVKPAEVCLKTESASEFGRMFFAQLIGGIVRFPKRCSTKTRLQSKLDIVPKQSRRSLSFFSSWFVSSAQFRFSDCNVSFSEIQFDAARFRRDISGVVD